MGDMFQPKVLVFLFVVVSTILLLIFQYTNVSNIFSNSLVQTQIPWSPENNGQNHLQELQRNGFRDNLGIGGMHPSHWFQNQSSSSRQMSIAEEPTYTFTFRKWMDDPYYPHVFNYDERGRVPLDLKDGRWTLQRPGANEKLVLLNPELFDKIPTKFLSNFKNPCWLRDETELNCLPYFYIIGMYKCATTDIWDKLVSHPNVYKAPKEPHWWGPRRHGWLRSHVHTDAVLHARDVTGGPDDRSLEWYLNLYKSKSVPALLENRITRGGKPYYPTVFGDASISTAYSIGLDWKDVYHQDAVLPKDKRPVYTNAELIKALQPKAKVILMVRNPTKRAISWWWYSHKSYSNKPKRSYSAKTLHEEMLGFVKCFNDCLETYNLRYCAYVSGCPYDLIPDIQAGIYHVYLQDWIKAFSRDSVLVIRLEDWQANQTEIYRKLLNFLDLPQLSSSQLNDILDREVKNVNHKEHEEVWPQTIELLDDFYRPYNEEMAKLMGDDKFLYL